VDGLATRVQRPAGWVIRLIEFAAGGPVNLLRFRPPVPTIAERIPLL
jgi:hypothetical protein